MAATRATSRTDHPLVGRERELAELDAALAAAGQGSGSLVLLAGEPGIGKTRLAAETAERAAARGYTVAWGAAWDGGGAPAYWPWTQLLRGLAAAPVGAEALAELGPAREALATVLGESGDAPAGPAAAGDRRFAALDALGRFLAALAARAPVLAVLDDLHAADEPSFRALEFVAGGLAREPVAIVATLHDRRVDPRPEIEAAIGRLGRLGRTVGVRGLDTEALDRLVAERAGGAVPGLAERLAALTAGNPFYAGEVLRVLAAEGRLEARGAIPLPDGVRAAVERRAAALSGEARDLLVTAAVIGEQFRLAVLERAADLPGEAALTLLDEATAAGLADELEGEAGAFRFVHGLVRATMLAGLGPAERARRHRAVARALEALPGTTSGPGLDELAHHFLAAAPAGDAERALDYAAAAAGRALERAAPERAAELLARALPVAELAGAEPGRMAELRHGLGRAQRDAGRPEARLTLLEAAAEARAAGDAARLGAIALDVAHFGLSPGVVDVELAGLLEEALAALGDGDQRLRARLLVRLAVALYWSDAVERREALVAEALELARAAGDPATLAFALNHGHLATWSPDTVERSLEWAAELLRLGDTAGARAEVLQARAWQINLLLEVDDLPGADVALEGFERHAAELRSATAQERVLLERARRRLLEGDFAEAERLAAAAAEWGERIADPTAPLLGQAQAFAVGLAQGRLDELEPAVRRLADGLPAMPVWRCALTLLLRDLGREAEARREFERLAADRFARLPRDNVYVLALALLSEACAYLGDAERAAILRELLAPYAARNVVSPQAVFLGPVPRYLALLDGVAGDLERALGGLAEARRRAEGQGARPAQALIALDEARLLAGAGRSAGEALARARELAVAMGQEALIARVERVAGELGGEGPAPAAPDPAAAPAAGQGEYVREGEMWTLRLGESTVGLRDGKGPRLLARLLERPGVELHALDLETGGSGPGAGSAGDAREDRLAARSGGDAGALLDPQAKAAYRERLEELREEIEEAERFHDGERASRAHAEMDFLAQELSAAVGLGGRDRRAASDAERARVNVTRALRGTIRRVSDADPALGRELESTVRTGIFCAYEPDVRRPIAWRVRD